MTYDELVGVAARCVSAYLDECPDEPEVLAFKALMAELRDNLEGLTDGDS